MYQECDLCGERYHDSDRTSHLTTRRDGQTICRDACQARPRIEPDGDGWFNVHDGRGGVAIVKGRAAAKRELTALCDRLRRELAENKRKRASAEVGR